MKHLFSLYMLAIAVVFGVAGYYYPSLAMKQGLPLPLNMPREGYAVLFFLIGALVVFMDNIRSRITALEEQVVELQETRKHETPSGGPSQSSDTTREKPHA